MVNAPIIDSSNEANPPSKDKGAIAAPAQGAPSPKTIGEKWYDGLRFSLGEVFILASTLALAYISKYGKPDYFNGKVPNILQKIDTGIKDGMLDNKILPLKERGDFGKSLAHSSANATTLMWGGNTFVLVWKWLQDRKEPIVTFFNEKFGKPGEVEAGRERLASQQKESWGDIIKGRIGSWVVVFSSFFGADMLLGKDTQGNHRLGNAEDAVGKWVAGFTREGKEIIAKTPEANVIKALEDIKGFRIGKILSLDIFATTAALIIWSSISKFSAMMHKKKTYHGPTEQLTPTVSNLPADIALPDEEQQSAKTPYTSRLGTRPANFRALAEKDVAVTSTAIS